MVSSIFLHGFFSFPLYNDFPKTSDQKKKAEKRGEKR